MCPLLALLNDANINQTWVVGTARRGRVEALPWGPNILNSHCECMLCAHEGKAVPTSVTSEGTYAPGLSPLPSAHLEEDQE